MSDDPTPPEPAPAEDVADAPEATPAPEEGVPEGEEGGAEYADESFAADDSFAAGEAAEGGEEGDAEAPRGESRGTEKTATTAVVNETLDGAVASAAELSQDLPDDMPDLNDADLEAAAVKIQAAQRGRAARAEVERLRAAGAAADVIEEKETEAAMFEGTEEEQAAAVRLQAMQRGRMVRAEVARLKEAGAAEEEVAAAQAKVDDAAAYEGTDEEQAAATKLQAAQRGKVARARVAAMKAEAAMNADDDDDGGGEEGDDMPDLNDADVEAAAVKIQAAQRGRAPPPISSAAPVPPRAFTKENRAPNNNTNQGEEGGATPPRPGDALFTKRQPVHAYLAQNIQLAVRHALRALSSQRPEEPFILAADIIRNWTPEAAAPRLSRPAGGTAVGAREYLESTSILKVLHDGMCAMAKVRPSDPRQFVADYLLDHAPVPAYVQAMEGFGTEEQLAKMDALHKGAREALDAAQQQGGGDAREGEEEGEGN